jgi:uncharacterized membrane protein YedE/YeeE
VNRILLSATGGLLMALGLGVSGMTRPSVVLGFLDVAGHWNPTGLFVMAAAALTYGIAFQVRQRFARRLHAGPIRLPDSQRPDVALVMGAAVFGVGWGISGLCPGPAIIDLAGGARPLVVFVASMVGGMALFALTASGGWRGLRAELRRRRRS